MTDLERDKELAKYNLKLKESLDYLFSIEQFNFLVDHINKDLELLGSKWAVNNDPNTGNLVQAIYLLKYYLKEIQNRGFQAKQDLENIKQYEENHFEEILND